MRAARPPPAGELDQVSECCCCDGEEVCAGTVLTGAAGPVGFDDADDFGQDGLANLADACPRLPVAPHSCDGADDCPDGAQCTPAARCNHIDHDADGVGGECDTCPDVANPGQITEAGAMLDDPDGDFIGVACERNEEGVDYALSCEADVYPLVRRRRRPPVRFGAAGLLYKFT